jgi:hypothetical protein
VTPATLGFAAMSYASYAAAVGRIRPCIRPHGCISGRNGASASHGPRFSLPHMLRAGFRGRARTARPAFQSGGACFHVRVRAAAARRVDSY